MIVQKYYNKLLRKKINIKEILDGVKSVCLSMGLSSMVFPAGTSHTFRRHTPFYHDYILLLLFIYCDLFRATNKKTKININETNEGKTYT